MTIHEAIQFYKTDRKEYILTKNSSFLAMYNKQVKKGIEAISIVNLQDLISQIVHFYEFKYPDKQLDEGSLYYDFPNLESLEPYLTIDQLRYRLDMDQQLFLDGSYRTSSYGVRSYTESIIQNGKTEDQEKNEVCNNYYIKDQDQEEFVLRQIIIQASPSGDIRAVYNYLDRDKEIELHGTTLLEIYEELKNSGFNLDISSLEKSIKEHDFDCELRKQVLHLAALKLLYNRDTYPEYGSIRAVKMIEEMNEYYGINISPKMIHAIMNQDYAGNDTHKEKKAIKKKIFGKKNQNNPK